VLLVDLSVKSRVKTVNKIRIKNDNESYIYSIDCGSNSGSSQMDGSTLMLKIFLASLIVAFGLIVSGCEEKKTTDELLKENSAKEAELIKKSVSEKADKVGDAISKELDKLKK